MRILATDTSTVNPLGAEPALPVRLDGPTLLEPLVMIDWDDPFAKDLLTGQLLINTLGPEQVAQYSKKAARALSLNPGQVFVQVFASLTPSQALGLHLGQLSAAQLAALSPAVVAALSLRQLMQIRLATLTDDQGSGPSNISHFLDAITPEQYASAAQLINASENQTMPNPSGRRILGMNAMANPLIYALAAVQKGSDITLTFKNLDNQAPFNANVQEQGTSQGGLQVVIVNEVSQPPLPEQGEVIGGNGGTTPQEQQNPISPALGGKPANTQEVIEILKELRNFDKGEDFQGQRLKINQHGNSQGKPRGGRNQGDNNQPSSNTNNNGGNGNGSGQQDNGGSNGGSGDGKPPYQDPTIVVNVEQPRRTNQEVFDGLLAQRNLNGLQTFLMNADNRVDVTLNSTNMASLVSGDSGSNETGFECWAGFVGMPVSF